MKKINLIQGTEEWKAYRREKIGASDCPAIMGCGYVTAHQLWKQKVTGAEQFVTPSMQRGSDLEAEARAKINEGMEHKFEPAVYECEEFPFMIASLDGVGDILQVIEIKCPSEGIFKEFQAYGTIPDAWFWQVQHQMAVTGSESVRIFAYNGVILASQTVERDETAISDLIAKETAFYKCMCEFTPPKAPLPEKEDPELVSLMDMLGEAKENLRNWETRVSELRSAILLKNQSGEEYQCKGFEVRYIVKPGTINYKAVPELKGVNLEAYRGKPIEYWTIS